MKLVNRLSGSKRRGAASIVCSTALALGAFASADAATVGSPDAQAYAHAADCVAVLKPMAATLAQQVRAGNTAVEPELLHLTESGYSFIGEAYKAGLRKDDADRILDAAEESQKGMSEVARARLVSACRSEGERILADANAFERAMVSMAAKKRVKRMIER